MHVRGHSRGAEQACAESPGEPGRDCSSRVGALMVKEHPTSQGRALYAQGLRAQAHLISKTMSFPVGFLSTHTGGVDTLIFLKSMCSLVFVFLFHSLQQSTMKDHQVLEGEPDQVCKNVRV